MTEPDYSPGQTRENGRPICGARKRDDGVCGASPARGATRCRRHGGNAPRAKAAATKRVTTEKARTILGRIDPEAPRQHPVETLIDLIREKHAEVIWLRQVVRDLTEEELTWGRTEHQTGVGPMGPVDTETFKAEQNIWWKLLREAENQLANWTTMAAKAGVEEREVRILEEQADKIVRALNQFIAGLQLTQDQSRRIPELLPQMIRSLEGKAA